QRYLGLCPRCGSLNVSLIRLSQFNLTGNAQQETLLLGPERQFSRPILHLAGVIRLECRQVVIIHLFDVNFYRPGQVVAFQHGIVVRHFVRHPRYTGQLPVKQRDTHIDTIRYTGKDIGELIAKMAVNRICRQRRNVLRTIGREQRNSRHEPAERRFVGMVLGVYQKFGLPEIFTVRQSDGIQTIEFKNPNPCVRFDRRKRQLDGQRWIQLKGLTKNSFVILECYSGLKRRDLKVSHLSILGIKVGLRPGSQSDLLAQLLKNNSLYPMSLLCNAQQLLVKQHLKKLCSNGIDNILFSALYPRRLSAKQLAGLSQAVNTIEPIEDREPRL